MVFLKVLLVLVALGIESGGYCQSYFEHDSKDNYARHAKIWQFGWMGVFVGSLILNGQALSSDEKTHAEKFDARLSLVTSGSGLLSLIVNPLPIAYEGSSESERRPQLFQTTKDEVSRRRSWGHIAFLLAEQVVVAGAIAFYDDRQKDAVERFAVGALVSGLFVYTTPLSEMSGTDLGFQLLRNDNGLAAQVNFSKTL